jgi:hypothetical protein
VLRRPAQNGERVNDCICADLCISIDNNMTVEFHAVVKFRTRAHMAISADVCVACFGTVLDNSCRMNTHC